MPLIFDDFLACASPTTLASLIADIDVMPMPLANVHREIMSRCLAALVANVGEATMLVVIATRVAS